MSTIRTQLATKEANSSVERLMSGEIISDFDLSKVELRKVCSNGDQLSRQCNFTLALFVEDDT